MTVSREAPQVGPKRGTSNYSVLLCRALREPVMPKLRGTDEFHRTRAKIAARMRAAADLIERYEQQIADERLLSYWSPEGETDAPNPRRKPRGSSHDQQP